jgi:hypothetical protein
MSDVRDPKKSVTKRNELGREAPMVITPSAFLRLIRRILGRGGQR